MKKIKLYIVNFLLKIIMKIIPDVYETKFLKLDIERYFEMNNRRNNYLKYFDNISSKNILKFKPYTKKDIKRKEI